MHLIATELRLYVGEAHALFLVGGVVVKEVTGLLPNGELLCMILRVELKKLLVHLMLKVLARARALIIAVALVVVNVITNEIPPLPNGGHRLTQGLLVRYSRSRYSILITLWECSCGNVTVFASTRGFGKSLLWRFGPPIVMLGRFIRGAGGGRFKLGAMDEVKKVIKTGCRSIFLLGKSVSWPDKAS